MRAVLVHVTDADLANRRSRGLDRWDEMWEGVLHMTPAPSVEHQRILDELVMFLGRHLSAVGRGTLRSGINVFKESSDYRIPDLTFVATGREHVVEQDGVRGGAPDAVIEIRSPEDETFEKLPFYSALGTKEVIVIDRDTKQAQVFRLAGGYFVALQTDAEGWLLSETMGVRFRMVEGRQRRLRIEDAQVAAANTEI